MGDVHIQARHQAIMRQHLEDIRAFFSHRYGLEATTFTVLVATDYEAMARSHLELVGRPIPQLAGWAWVSTAPTGDAVLFLFRPDVAALVRDLDWDGTDTKSILTHEYYHVLQHQLYQGSSPGAWWLFEGLAEYFSELLYPPLEPRSLAKEMGWARARGFSWPDDPSIELARIETPEEFWDGGVDSDGFNTYTLSSVASRLLVEDLSESHDSHVSYWKLLGEGLPWRQAFEEAFGISTRDFYSAFRHYVSTSVHEIPMVSLTVQVHWPEHGGLPPLGSIDANIDWQGSRTYAAASYSSTADPGLSTTFYPEGFVSSAFLKLWWSPSGDSDPCTYFLGWYKDGGLTTRIKEATLVEITGMSTTIDWNIPGHPSTLPPQPCRFCPCPGE